MNSVFFTLYSGAEAIHGIAECPETPFNHAIVFLHGWGGYRTGPHDLFVKISARLTTINYCCIRFDFRGKGYSGEVTTAATPANMLSDLQQVIDYARRELHCKTISLAGICSGAKMALYYAMKGASPIEHVIELSSAPLNPVLNQTELALKHSSRQLHDYLNKACRIDTWTRFLRGDLHLKHILHNIFSPLRRSSVQTRPLSLTGQECNRPAFQNFHGKMLLIHGEKDPETEITTAQLQTLLRKHALVYELYIIEGANHSFYSLAWETEIIDRICLWLSACEQKSS